MKIFDSDSAVSYSLVSHVQAYGSNNTTPPELGSLVLPPGPLFMYCGFLDSTLFRPTRALLIWANGRAGEDISMHSIRLNVSWKEETSRLDRIWPLQNHTKKEGRLGSPLLPFFPLILLDLNIWTKG